MKKWELSRRTFLRGAGTLVALPALEAMWPSIARAQAAGATPRRLFYFYTPCGIHMQAFTPKTTGPNFELSETLQPLANVKSHVTVVTGLANHPANPDGFGHHASGTAAFLTCTHAFKTAGADIRNGISVDQVAARALKGKTRFASLELGTHEGGQTGNCDSGYSCAYTRNISWSGPATPMAKETQPLNVFNRLFADMDPNQSATAAAKRKLYRKSVLDFVKEDATALQKKVGRSDQRKLDEYLSGIREVEQRVDQESAACAVGAAPANPADVPLRTKLLLDLSVLAFQCDQTRVITFMLQNGLSGHVYSNLGLTSGHHVYSHHQGAQANYDALKKIDRWEVSQFAYLLEKMKAIQEPGGTMLDNSLCYFSSEISDGNAHNYTNLPVLLGGRGGGMVNSGRHVKLAAEAPLANLFLAMLRTVGEQTPSFGNSTGVLNEIFS